MAHKINISTGAARVLFQYMHVPGVHTGTLDPYYVALLVSSHLLSVARLPADILNDNGSPKEPEFSEWMKAPFPEFEIPEIQRDAVKHAFETLGKNKAISADSCYVELAPVFGLIPAG